MVRQWQRYIFNNRIIAVDFERNPDFVKLAEAFDIEGVRPESYEELKIAVTRAIRNNQPMIIDLRINKEEEVVKPWVIPGKWLTETLLPGDLKIDLVYRGE